LAVPDAVRERILAQKDLERLERWLEKAVVAASVAAVLDEPKLRAVKIPDSRFSTTRAHEILYA
jgi:hypothetical protein